MQDAYLPVRPGQSRFVALRGLRYHLNVWGEPDASSTTPLLVLTHGWMDVGASFQFLVDALSALGDGARRVVAPDWRGYGRTEGPAGADSYWFPDYMGDLDALLDALSPAQPVDLLGHSMGGNVVMAYAGARPERIRRLVNLEGFGLPRSTPAQWPARLSKWMDELKTPQSLPAYDTLQDVAQRLLKIHPRMSPARASWLAPHWSGRSADGRWQVLGDPAHKRVNPALYQVDEHLEAWKRIQAPLLWVEGADTELAKWWGDRYSKAEFQQRLTVVRQVQQALLPDCGHMMHVEQPEALARALLPFLGA